MDSPLSIKHVPWTCRWGRFGGPVDPNDPSAPGFVFWVCGHPQTMGPIEALQLLAELQRELKRE